MNSVGRDGNGGNSNSNGSNRETITPIIATNANLHTLEDEDILDMLADQDGFLDL